MIACAVHCSRRPGPVAMQPRPPARPLPAGVVHAGEPLRVIAERLGLPGHDRPGPRPVRPRGRR